MKNESIFFIVYQCNCYFADDWQYRPVARKETRTPLEREVWGSNLGPFKSDTVLPTASYRWDISSKGAVLPWRKDAEMDPANSLQDSAYYSEYNKKIDLKRLHTCTRRLLVAI